MQFYQCKCGNIQCWTSMGVPRCSKSPQCGSDLAQGSTEHSETVPHEYVKRYDQFTGVPYQICRACLRRETEILADEPAAQLPETD